MTNVISFPIKRRTATAATPEAGQARILLFTGIRYVRDEVDTPAAPQPAPVAEDRLQA